VRGPPSHGPIPGLALTQEGYSRVASRVLPVVVEADSGLHPDAPARLYLRIMSLAYRRLKEGK
jgi:hypothetical protein